MGNKKRAKAKAKKAKEKANSTNTKRRQKYANMAQGRELGAKEEKKRAGTYQPKGPSRTGEADHLYEVPFSEVEGSYGHAQTEHFAAYARDRRDSVWRRDYVEITVRQAPDSKPTNILSLKYLLGSALIVDESPVRNVQYSTGGIDPRLRNLDRITRSLNGPGGSQIREEVKEIKGLVREVQQATIR